MKYGDIYDEKECQAFDWEFAGQIHSENPFRVKYFITNVFAYVTI